MIVKQGLSVDQGLVTFIEEQALPGTGIDPDHFWRSVAAIFSRFAPENAALLATRDRLQDQIDAWHDARRGERFIPEEYRTFLGDIGYILEEPAPFAVGTINVDPEVAAMAGPQLVVPVLNARFALNAANARWGSLYDALYGTDAISDTPDPGSYDSERGAKVVARAKAFLDEALPLASGSWNAVVGGEPELSDPGLFVGRNGANLLFRHNGLHIELVIDPAHPIGRNDPAHIADVVLEAALTTICDFEDSLATVDAEDKVAAYANWLGLMRSDLV